jgi:eukaryotic-like serine/threonine-protein kinase
MAAGVAPSPPMPPSGRRGDVVDDRYVLGRLVGVGGMGAVWAAHDQRLDRAVALKEITTGDGDQASAEARAAGQVDHPGVVGVHEVVRSGSVPWIVMEMVPGHSLARHIRRRGKLAVPTVQGVARQLLAAVCAVHGAGLVHRDITPGNVLFTEAGRVVLADFGLATPQNDCAVPTAGQFLGSPPYVAPKTVREGRFGTAADLFALGATLFATVEGRRPFDAATVQATMRALVSAPRPPVRHAGELEPLLRGLLRKDPERRLTAEQAWELLPQAA